MKAIQDVLGNNKKLQAAQTELVEELSANPLLTTFFTTHQLTKSEILAAALELQAYAEYCEKQQKGIIASGNSNLEGVLKIDEHRRISFGYQYAKNYEELVKMREYVECFYMDEQMLKATITDFKDEKLSNDLVTVMNVVASIRKQQLPTKGFFIAGDNGVGKTHLLLAVAKEYYRQEIKSIVVFFPELIRDLKQNPYNAANIIKRLQRAPILMIDDIGSEMQTSFSRDEILLPILNARMNDKKVTYFSSNLDYNSLQHHFSHTQYGENEPIKGKRVMERIISLTNPITMVGKNKRR